MKNLTLCILLTCCFAVYAPAQTASPTPPQRRDDDVVKITTSLIQVDVSVTDAKGKPVPDLKAEDFEIYENGRKQKINGLSFVSSANKTTAAEKVTDDKVPVPVPPTVPKPEQVRRTIAL